MDGDIQELQSKPLFADQGNRIRRSGRDPEVQAKLKRRVMGPASRVQPRSEPRAKTRKVPEVEVDPEFLPDVLLDDDLEKEFETFPGMSERIEEDGWEMSAAWENSVVAGAQDMLKSLLKRKVLREAIPYALQETYRQWLIKIYN